MPTATELALAFDGVLERSHTPIGYRIGVLLVACVMVLLPIVYLAMIAATAWGVAWYARSAVGMFEHVRGRAIIFVFIIYAAPIIAGGLVVIFMILPLFWRGAKREKTLWVDRREQPLLYAYVEHLCDTMGVPRPYRIDVTAEANASAHVDNGWWGLFRRRLVLTIGLPLVTGFDLREFTGVLAHEFGHFAQGGSMRLQRIVHSINMWFMRMAFTRTGIDDSLDAMLGEEPHWTVAIIGLISKLALGTARLALKLMSLLSHLLAMNMSRQAEFDADRHAARVVGSEAMSAGLERVPFVALANGAAIKNAQQGWARKSLPDDLILLTGHFLTNMPAKTKDSLTAQILTAESSWFDTHPPLYQRIGRLKKAKWKGVMKLNGKSELLFKEFDELCKLSTMSLYHDALGDALKPEYLAPTNIPSAKPAG